MSLDDARDRIARWQKRWRTEEAAIWAIAEPGSGSPVGLVGLADFDFDGGSAEFLYWLLPAGRGREAMVDAVVRVSRWALEDLGLHRLRITHSVANAVSCRVAEKAGLLWKGRCEAPCCTRTAGMTSICMRVSKVTPGRGEDARSFFGDIGDGGGRPHLSEERPRSAGHVSAGTGSHCHDAFWSRSGHGGPPRRDRTGGGFTRSAGRTHPDGYRSRTALARRALRRNHPARPDAEQHNNDDTPGPGGYEDCCTRCRSAVAAAASCGMRAPHTVSRPTR
ncbi:GNAT family N-acetyltransferase [Actinacidiphila glaucinigra]|uniref:GNAT family N-acetyltransferase n=1 Tax=Actinacidiphila glaucinigra TaxID=235986 RepID=UPI0035D8D143